MLIFVLVIKLKYGTSLSVEIQNISNCFMTTESPQKQFVQISFNRR